MATENALSSWKVTDNIIGSKMLTFQMIFDRIQSFESFADRPKDRMYNSIDRSYFRKHLFERNVAGKVTFNDLYVDSIVEIFEYRLFYTQFRYPLDSMYFTSVSPLTNYYAVDNDQMDGYINRLQLYFGEPNSYDTWLPLTRFVNQFRKDYRALDTYYDPIILQLFSKRLPNYSDDMSPILEQYLKVLVSNSPVLNYDPAARMILNTYFGL